MGKQQKPNTNEHKLVIINSYAEGIPPSVMLVNQATSPSRDSARDP
jgi:hypothetical protein